VRCYNVTYETCNETPAVANLLLISWFTIASALSKQSSSIMWTRDRQSIAKVMIFWPARLAGTCREQPPTPFPSPVPQRADISVDLKSAPGKKFKEQSKLFNDQRIALLSRRLRTKWMKTSSSVASSHEGNLINWSTMYVDVTSSFYAEWNAYQAEWSTIRAKAWLR